MLLLSRLSMAIVIAMAFAVAPAYSQTGDAKKKPADLSGRRPWVVTKGSLTDFSGRSDEAVADFDTEAEANAYAERRNEEEKEWTKWTYVVTKRDRGGSTNGGREKDDRDGTESALRRLARGETSASPSRENSEATRGVKRPIVVRVYKREGNQWVEQRDRRYETLNDFEAASNYFNTVNKVKGWSASWNAPGWPKPARPSTLAGTRWVITYNDMDGRTYNGSMLFKENGEMETYFTTQDGRNTTTRGTWRQEDKSMRMQFERSVMSGQINGVQMQGDLKFNSGPIWSWSATKSP